MIVTVTIAPAMQKTSDASSAAPIWRRVSAMCPPRCVARRWSAAPGRRRNRRPRSSRRRRPPPPKRRSSEPTASRTMGITMSVPAICSSRCATPAKDENAACRPRRSPRTDKGPESRRLALFARLSDFACRLASAPMPSPGRAAFSLSKPNPASVLEDDPGNDDGAGEKNNQIYSIILAPRFSAARREARAIFALSGLNSRDKNSNANRLTDRETISRRAARASARPRGLV